MAAARSIGRMLSHSNAVPQLSALLKPKAIFPPSEDDEYGTSGLKSNSDDEYDGGLDFPPTLPPPPSPIGLETRGELLCLDVGKRRTGVAVTQFVVGDVHATRILHHPSRRAGGDERMKALQDDITYLERIIHDHNVVGLVVGWPLEPHTGKPGVQCERVQSFVMRLQQAALLMSLSSGLLDENYGTDTSEGSDNGANSQSGSAKDTTPSNPERWRDLGRRFALKNKTENNSPKSCCGQCW